MEQMEQAELSLLAELDDNSLQHVQGGLDKGQKIGIGIGAGAVGTYLTGGAAVIANEYRQRRKIAEELAKIHPV
jgi:hypothetical protein